MDPSCSLIGWREWVALPDLNILHIKAKIDTGARTSALHAFEVDTFQENGKNKVRFALHPKQRSVKKVITCVTDLVDTRTVTDSGGHKELRHVIQTDIIAGAQRWPIEITLTCREDMRFRFLLGRNALRGHYCVEPAASYLLGKNKK
jgi:hypothetical protein